MLFNSLLFPVFLVVVFGVSWGLARMQALRLAFLLLASWLFYMSWHPWFIVLIAFSTLVDFFLAIKIEDTPKTDEKTRKRLLYASLISNLGLLGYFKYTNFFLGTVGGVLSSIGFDAAIPHFNILLPVGISFYTFQTISYTVDVYRGDIKAERRLGRFALYVTFFPQLVAGPIVRAVDFLPQLDATPSITREDVSAALFRITRGLVKKVVIADFLAVNIVDRAFSDPSLFSGAELMVALYAYTMQIYCDFSGYTDVAIGAARLLGYKLPENFDRPYQATSVAHFWRRWHKTLAQWLRYYVFFPLGGSRGGVWMAHRNTFITLILIGLWHGADWKFVVYGAIHGIAVSINRVLARKHKAIDPNYDTRAQPWFNIIWKVFVTFHFVVLARILFRADGFSQSWDYLAQMMTNGFGLVHIDTGVWWILGISYAIHWTPRSWITKAGEGWQLLTPVAQGAALAAMAAVVATVAEKDVVPFIYFQF